MRRRQAKTPLGAEAAKSKELYRLLARRQKSERVEAGRGAEEALWLGRTGGRTAAADARTGRSKRERVDVEFS